MKSLVSVLLVCSVTMSVWAQQQDKRDEPRPIAAMDTVWMEAMTYMEIRDAIRAGKTTVLVMAGGPEEFGPYVVTGQHQYNMKQDGEIIARKLGNALVAPLVALNASNRAPETNSRLLPGTFHVRKEVFKGVLEDVSGSLKQHGFKDIVFLSDHGSNGTPMEEVSEALKAKWAGQPAVHHVTEYRGQHVIIDETLLPSLGIHEESEGIHDSFRVEALLMAANPDLVRFKQRVAAGKTTVNRNSILPAEKTIEIGKKIIELKTDNTVAAIRKAVESGG